MGFDVLRLLLPHRKGRRGDLRGFEPAPPIDPSPRTADLAHVFEAGPWPYFVEIEDGPEADLRYERLIDALTPEIGAWRVTYLEGILLPERDGTYRHKRSEPPLALDAAGMRALVADAFEYSWFFATGSGLPGGTASVEFVVFDGGRWFLGSRDAELVWRVTEAFAPHVVDARYG